MDEGGPIAGIVVVAARGRLVLSVAMKSGNKAEEERRRMVYQQTSSSEPAEGMRTKRKSGPRPSY
jgi:hypothetical protein